MATSLNSLLVGAQEELDKLKDQDDRLAAEICHMQSEVAAKQTEQDAVRQRINAIENAQEVWSSLLASIEHITESRSLGYENSDPRHHHQLIRCIPCSTGASRVCVF